MGDPNGYSAMAKSVGTTCGVAAQLLLDRHPALVGNGRCGGVVAPYTREMCEANREGVEQEGIVMVEEVLA